MATSPAQQSPPSNEETPQLPPRPEDTPATSAETPTPPAHAQDHEVEEISPEVAALKSMFPDFDALVL